MSAPTRARWIAAASFLAAAASPATAQSGNLFACAVPQTPAEGRLATCTGRASSRHDTWTFVLRGEPPNRVARIEIYEPGRDAPRQVIDGLDLKPPLIPADGPRAGRVAFVLQDVNFDRLNDLRIAVGPPAGDGTAFRWFLFDRAADAYVPTDALDTLRDPIFNASRKLVSGAFADERGRTGRVYYKWRDGKIDPVGAIAWERTEEGRCIASHYVMRDGKFEKRTETACRASSLPEAD